MSYVGIQPSFYEMNYPETPWHAGAWGWSTEPSGWGWGQNPNQRGPRYFGPNGLRAPDQAFAAQRLVPRNLRGLGAMLRRRRKRRPFGAAETDEYGTKEAYEGEFSEETYEGEFEEEEYPGQFEEEDAAAAAAAPAQTAPVSPAAPAPVPAAPSTKATTLGWVGGVGVLAVLGGILYFAAKAQKRVAYRENKRRRRRAA